MTTKFRTFNICQYEVNPKSGEDMHFNEENIPRKNFFVVNPFQ